MPAGAPISEFFAIELFAGSAGLTASLRALGLRQSFGVDHYIPKAVRGPVLTLDLTVPANVDILFERLRSPMLVYVHMGPPCGAASRAREIRVSRASHGPPPLRSMEHPDGLPHLTGTNRTRVDQANRLYALVALIWRTCHARGIMVTVENPTRSLFLHTSFWAAKPALMVDTVPNGLDSLPIFQKLLHYAGNVMGNTSTCRGVYYTSSGTAFSTSFWCTSWVFALMAVHTHCQETSFTLIRSFRMSCTWSFLSCERRRATHTRYVSPRGTPFAIRISYSLFLNVQEGFNYPEIMRGSRRRSPGEN